MRSITCPRKRAKITSHFAEDDDSGSGASCTVFSGVRPLFYQVVGSDPEFRKRCTRRLTHFCKMRSYFCALPYRKRRPAIALTDVSDLGPLRLPAGRPRWDDGVSVALDQRSTWMLWTDDGASPS